MPDNNSGSINITQVHGPAMNIEQTANNSWTSLHVQKASESVNKANEVSAKGSEINVALTLDSTIPSILIAVPDYERKFVPFEIGLSESQPTNEDPTQLVIPTAATDQLHIAHDSRVTSNSVMKTTRQRDGFSPLFTTLIKHEVKEETTASPGSVISQPLGSIKESSVHRDRLLMEHPMEMTSEVNQSNTVDPLSVGPLLKKGVSSKDSTATKPMTVYAFMNSVVSSNSFENASPNLNNRVELDLLPTEAQGIPLRVSSLNDSDKSHTLVDSNDSDSGYLTNLNLKHDQEIKNEDFVVKSAFKGDCSNASVLEKHSEIKTEIDDMEYTQINGETGVTKSMEVKDEISVKVSTEIKDEVGELESTEVKDRMSVSESTKILQEIGVPESTKITAELNVQNSVEMTNGMREDDLNVPESTKIVDGMIVPESREMEVETDATEFPYKEDISNQSEESALTKILNEASTERPCETHKVSKESLNVENKSIVFGYYVRGSKVKPLTCDQSAPEDSNSILSKKNNGPLRYRTIVPKNCLINNQGSIVTSIMCDQKGNRLWQRTCDKISLSKTNNNHQIRHAAFKAAQTSVIASASNQISSRPHNRNVMNVKRSENKNPISSPVLNAICDISSSLQGLGPQVTVTPRDNSTELVQNAQIGNKICVPKCSDPDSTNSQELACNKMIVNPHKNINVNTVNTETLTAPVQVPTQETDNTSSSNEIKFEVTINGLRSVMDTSTIPETSTNPVQVVRTQKDHCNSVNLAVKNSPLDNPISDIQDIRLTGSSILPKVGEALTHNIRRTTGECIRNQLVQNKSSNFSSNNTTHPCYSQDTQGNESTELSNKTHEIKAETERIINNYKAIAPMDVDNQLHVDPSNNMNTALNSPSYVHCTTDKIYPGSTVTISQAQVVQFHYEAPQKSDAEPQCHLCQSFQPHRIRVDCGKCKFSCHVKCIQDAIGLHMIQCDRCLGWNCVKCSKISNPYTLKMIRKCKNLTWFCDYCLPIAKTAIHNSKLLS